MTDATAFDTLRVEPVAPEVWHDTVERALAAGERAVDLHAARGELRLLLAGDEGGQRLLTCEPAGGEAPSIVDLAPALGWAEREAHDLYAVRFPGHDPLRPLVEHDLDLKTWTVPVRGHDPYHVAVGPIHAGVIESGHFRFHLVGERILHLDVRLFYKHRGLERAAEGETLTAGLAYAQRACAACAVTNTVAYAQACEQALGLWPDRELASVRTVLLELERLYNHVHDIGQLCAGVGFAAGAMTFLSLKERAQRLNERIAGHRFLFGTVAVGKSPVSLDGETARHAREEVQAIGAAAERAWREILFNGSVQDRLDDVGTVPARTARQLGAVGPAARASGIAGDVRTASPRLAYDGFAEAAPSRPSGDVRARLELRALELRTTVPLLERLLEGPLGSGGCTLAAEPSPVGAARVESPRGETACVIEHAGERIARLRLRTGSYANWPVVARAAADNLLPDFPLVNKSFELCYACSDR
jgi:Ni,Fe-hydrogenase III large subunit